MCKVWGRVVIVVGIIKENMRQLDSKRGLLASSIPFLLLIKYVFPGIYNCFFLLKNDVAATWTHS